MVAGFQYGGNMHKKGLGIVLLCFVWLGCSSDSDSQPDTSSGDTGADTTGCTESTCGEDGLCTDAGTCLQTGDACGNVPPNGICQDGALLSCQGGALVVEPCAGCCIWDADLATATCGEGAACESCVDECESGTSGCNDLGTHAWICEDIDDDDCLDRAYTVCDRALCDDTLGACVDPSLDADDDGVPDALDNCLEESNADQLDSDDDGEGDACDTDIDGDGTDNDDDAFPNDPAEQSDSDEDGLGDNADNCPEAGNADQLDSDDDGEGDACDTDDDGDGVLDEDDNCPGLVTDNTTDTDDDGHGDACDVDDDDDGVLDEADNCPLTANVGQADTDDDSAGDACDDDDDGDSVLDGDDNCPELATTDTTDTDDDGHGDACDVDDDDDGVLDEADNCPLTANVGQADTDDDNEGDACDDDIDGDLTPNDEDTFPTDSTEQADSDADSVGDNADNCPGTSNTDQADLDDDGEGDACDVDDDGDDVLDDVDNCPELATGDTSDTDDDGAGDACDVDDDGDGVLDTADNCPLTPNVGQQDADNDGEGDACDADTIPCSFDGLADLPGTSLPATLPLGDFDVVVTSEALVVRHTDEPTRDLFAPPTDSTWLHISRAHLEAEEHQGSFALHEDVFTTCKSPVISAAHYQTGSLLLVGGFADDDAECAAADWTARICETGPHRLSVKIAPDDSTFDLITLRTESDPDEYIWGAGEQFPHNSLNLNGRTLPIIAQEGGLGRGHVPITPAVNAFSEGSGGSEDSTYYAAAHYLTSRARSIFLENTETAFFDFSDDNAIELRLYAGEMAAQIVHGTEPLSLIERFTDWTGRMVAPPAWANQGAIVALARPLNDSLAHVDDLLDKGAALAGVWNQTWSGTATTYIGEQVLWNWVLNENAHPNWHDWVGALDERGIRVLCYINTMFRELPEDVGPVTRDLYAEGLAANYFVHDEEGEVLMLPVTAFDVALLDLANEDARSWMKAIIQDEMLDNAGCSGWMADFAEALPFEAVMADGLAGDVWHNRYPVEWAALNREALIEVDRLDDVLVYNRSGHTKSPGAAMVLWQGDQLVTWDKYDGLVSAIHGLVSGGFSGIAINHSDIGGYTSMGWLELGYSREEELLKRWTEMAAFTSIMRTHEGNQPPLNAQVYTNDSIREHFARMTRVYRALAFYRDQLFHEATTRGWPVVRHLAMHWPSEEALYDVSDHFLLGSEILVAPIKNKCFTWPWCPYDKEVTLPPGKWVHLWTQEVHGDLHGVSSVTVSAPLGKPAVFYPQGSTVGATFVANLLDEGIDLD